MLIRILIIIQKTKKGFNLITHLKRIVNFFYSRKKVISQEASPVVRDKIRNIDTIPQKTVRKKVSDNYKKEKRRKAGQQPKKKQVDNKKLNKVPMIEGKKRFFDFNINNNILYALQDMKFQYCTPIQEECFPHSFFNKDCTVLITEVFII